MLVLILGLVLFLGTHSVRIFAEPWRTRTLARVGEARWKAAYAVVSLIGFVLLAWGYGLARQQPVLLWTPPVAMRHIAALLTLVAFVLLAAAYVPGNGLKAKLHHPMVLSVKVWAFAHLLANGTLADVLLFGGFLVWAVLCFRAARGRDRATGVATPPGRAGATAITVVVGAVAWAVFAFWAHGAWIGVRPFG
ncbi:NnrU family protein [Methylibium petroleiphilum]|uniref:Putative membrane protein n=1 Tax=Methylibium petroleiphilum (strain ATCC BAA-1232 / LMG 22953 / PM1) TaxID=420662 RepID=A2SBS8_METPP|nr:NnrU family protein [Methylibium petroleiphilum]ABM93017.1 putative membrane protein [Methylibium petroleiphilum PM1]